MVSFSASPTIHDAATLLAPLRALAGRRRELEVGSAGRFVHGITDYEITRFRFVGPVAGHEPIRLGLFAGVHGDEPAGCHALVRFLTALAAEPGRAAGYDLSVYPVVNPTGLEDRTRTNRAGRDLNREFWRHTAQPEVIIVEDELRAGRFDGLVTLHADDTCEGLYGYSHGRTLDEMLLKPALTAAECVLPRDGRDRIDGFVAREGVICECFQGILAPPPESKPQPFNLIFETPGLAPPEQQVVAGVAALDTILAHYRGFIAHAQGI
jgi:hypothetical protein